MTAREKMGKEEEGIMDREAEFARTLEKVRQLAGEQGNCVSEEQVRSCRSRSGITFRIIWRS